MIYSENYGKVRPMTQQDIPSVLSIMNPFIKKQILLPRTEDELLTQINDFITYEIDECVCACAALHIYDNQAEIAAVAVDETYSHLGIGPKMINYLISMFPDALSGWAMLARISVSAWIFFMR